MTKELNLGPVGKGFVKEVTTKKGTRFVARWNAFVMKDGERKKVTCGPYEIGPKVSHGSGLKSLKDAQKEWDKVYWSVFQEHHPVTNPSISDQAIEASEQMSVKDFITLMYESRRNDGLEENSLKNWEYYRDSFLLPFFGTYTISQMNNEDAIRQFMSSIATREFSEWVAKKCFTYVKAILDTARDLGITRGNAARLIPKNRRIPKGVKKSKVKPTLTIEQFVSLRAAIAKPRDRMIANLLFLCALRRSEVFPLKWKDLTKEGDIDILKIERSFCSRTHKIKEWAGKQAGGSAVAVVALPPGLVVELNGWRQFGDSDGSDPEAFIFPTRNGTCLIPTNWIEDVLKPAGEKIGLPEVSLHWFRRSHATLQHHNNVADKPIQGQLRHSKAETTRNIYMQHVSPETAKAVVELETLVNVKAK
ncbi:MAG TPA: site-specific integrase [Bryobacteraceae bacterium]|nr:site-specific integrase [Bryobacteraceae bacterium]